MRIILLLATLVLYPAAVAALPVCAPPPATRADCVHDGDTWWVAGVKYQHSEIDAPEISHMANCGAEFDAGLAARDRLAALMRDGFSVEATGESDRHDRVLVTIRLSDGREAGQVLIDEELVEKGGAQPAIDWCAAR